MRDPNHLDHSEPKAPPIVEYRSRTAPALDCQRPPAPLDSPPHRSALPVQCVAGHDLSRVIGAVHESQLERRIVCIRIPRRRHAVVQILIQRLTVVFFARPTTAHGTIEISVGINDGDV